MRSSYSGNQPVYAPNSYGGPKADQRRYPDPGWFVDGAEITRSAYEAHKDDDDFVQPGMLYRNVMTPTDRDHLVDNIVWHLSQGPAIHPGASCQGLLGQGRPRPRHTHSPESRRDPRTVKLWRSASRWSNHGLVSSLERFAE